MAAMTKPKHSLGVVWDLKDTRHTHVSAIDPCGYSKHRSLPTLAGMPTQRCSLVGRHPMTAHRIPSQRPPFQVLWAL